MFPPPHNPPPPFQNPPYPGASPPNSQFSTRTPPSSHNSFNQYNSPYHAGPPSTGYPGQPPPPGYGPPYSGGPGGPAAPMFPGINPAYMLAGNFFSGGQQYVQRVQQQMGWLSATALHHYFSVTPAYVKSKLFMLLTPFLRKWTFIRQQEQISGAQRYQPPRDDVYAPDLYIPIVAVWMYVLLNCTVHMLKGGFTTDIMSSTVWWAICGWLLHMVVVKVMLGTMGLAVPVPFVEVAAYTGYSFVLISASIIIGFLAGSWAWWASWVYGSLMMARFIIQTLKSIIYSDARGYGNLQSINHLLLLLGAFQFVFAWFMGSKPHVSLSHHVSVASIMSPASALPTIGGGAMGAGPKLG